MIVRRTMDGVQKSLNITSYLLGSVGLEPPGEEGGAS